MSLVYRWLGAEIVFVHVGHGLVGAALLGVLAANVPWWFMLALAPLIAFSLAYWFMEARFVMPVARRFLSGDPFPAPAKATTATATTPPRGTDEPRG